MSIASAEHAVRRETAEWVEPVGRIGLASQGVLYAIVGVLALQLAAGHQEDRVDQRGALHAVASQPFGRVLLFALTIGLALHATWRLLLFLRGARGQHDAEDWAKRVGHLGRAAIYATFTWAALEVLLDAGGGASGTQREGVARALDWPLGPWLVGAIGLVIIGTGVWHASKIVTRSFEDDLDLTGDRRRFRPFAVGLGSLGFVGRGVVFALVGWFLVLAAWDHNANESGGLDNALKRLVDSEHGPGLLRLLALGVFTFGLYRIVDAWLRTRDAVSNA